jgi:LPXTG-motif cell wall-anchored protein
MSTTTHHPIRRVAVAVILLLAAFGATSALQPGRADAAAWRLTATSVDCPGDATYGTPETCTMTVTDLTPRFLGGGRTPTGTVSVGTILNRLIVDGSPCTLVGVDGRSASCSVTVTPTDTGHIAPGAVYSPTGDFLPSIGADVIYASPAPLVVSADPQSRPYGSPNPELTVSYDGFVLDQGPADLSGTLECLTDATEASLPGDFAIGCGGLSSSDYDVTFDDGTLTVVPAPLTVTADDATTTYGATTPAFGVTYDGFVLDQDPAVLDGSLECTSTGTGGHAGTYPIVCGGLTSTNYDITWVDATLTVDRAALTATADDAVRVFGTPDPAFTASFDGFVHGETVASLTGTLECSTTALPTSPVADYPIACTGLSSPDYDITWVDGSLEVLAAPAAVVDGDSVLQPGGTIDVDTDGWAPGSTVTVTACGVEVATITVDGEGRARDAIALPSDLPVGACELVLSGTDQADQPYAVVLGISLTAPAVVPADSVTPAGLLPYTGTTVGGLVLFAAVSLVAGAALVALRRRREV